MQNKETELILPDVDAPKRISEDTIICFPMAYGKTEFHKRLMKALRPFIGRKNTEETRLEISIIVEGLKKEFLKQ